MTLKLINYAHLAFEQVNYIIFNSIAIFEAFLILESNNLYNYHIMTVKSWSVCLVMECAINQNYIHILYYSWTLPHLYPLVMASKTGFKNIDVHVYQLQQELELLNGNKITSTIHTPGDLSSQLKFSKLMGVFYWDFWELQKWGERVKIFIFFLDILSRKLENTSRW